MGHRYPDEIETGIYNFRDQDRPSKNWLDHLNEMYAAQAIAEEKRREAAKAIKERGEYPARLHWLKMVNEEKGK